MSMRISDRRIALVSLALLAGCDSSPTANHGAIAEVEANSRSAAADDGRIDCAPAGETMFRRSCEIERSQDEKGALILTIRHPDGGFRRLMVTTDGRGVIAADGAEKAEVATISPREIEVTLAGNRYRLPATVKK